MSRKDTIEEKAWELLLKVCSEQGLVPVDAEYAKTGGEYNLLMYIDKEGGVGIDECEACSRALDPLLDEEDNAITDDGHASVTNGTTLTVSVSSSPSSAISNAPSAPPAGTAASIIATAKNRESSLRMYRSSL